METVIHYAQDAWTDKGMQNCYLGIYAYYIDSKFRRQSVLLQFMELRGKHEGRRIGQALFKLFDEMDIAGNLGPGTGDNASNNKSAANFLGDLLRANKDVDVHGKNMVGCICHIVNLAAKDFSNSESKSSEPPNASVSRCSLLYRWKAA